MSYTAGPGPFARWTLLMACCLAWLPTARAQDVPDDVAIGAAQQVWTKWDAAMQAVLAKDAAAAEAAFADLLSANPSPFRLAMFRDRTITGPTGGAVLLFEQDMEAGTLADSAKKVGELLAAGVEQKNRADDGWWFASIGRFDVAGANLDALLKDNPDPVALLEFADQNKGREQTLLLLVNHPQMGPAARDVLKLLGKGEWLIKADPARVKTNIDRLGGPPRAFENGVAALKDSGEYAVPFLVQYLRDPAKQALTPAILRCLPQVDRAGLNPLVMALRMDDPTVKTYVIRALGQIPYRQSVPYLLRLRDESTTPAAMRADIDATLASLRGLGVEFDEGIGAAQMFYSLADAYYENRGSLAADPRLDTANVWYWREDMIQNVPVTTEVFNEVMCMRACEEALLLNPEMKEPQALWLAANFRREAQLGDGVTDLTRPEKFASAAFWSQSAGAEYCMMALERAVRDGDAVVALGVIAALRNTGGPSSIVGGPGGSQPLAEALTFPNRLVRIRAALALGNGQPAQGFNNSQNLIPVLSEALMMHGGSRGALVVDPDAESANAVAGVLRGEGFTVLIDAGLLSGLDKVRKELPGLDVLFIASDVASPSLADGLRTLREDPLFRGLPAVIIAKRGTRDDVRALVRADPRLGEIMPQDEPGRVLAGLQQAAKAAGYEAVTETLGTALAQEAAETLRLLAQANSPLFDAARSQAALINVIGSTKDAMLRLTVAEVLGYLGSSEAQESIARIALNGTEEAATRIAMFAALAEAAKRRGNLLSKESAAALTELVRTETDDALRNAASQAMGALSLPGNLSSELIRKQYGG